MRNVVEEIKKENKCCKCGKASCHFFQTKVYCEECFEKERKGGK